jgi:hypothetical protein
MAKTQGTVRLIPNKPFGFIKTLIGDIFFHKNDYPKGQTAADGDSVECEMEDVGKGPAVKKSTLKVLANAASGSPAPVPTNVVSSAVLVNLPQSKLDGQFAFDDPVEKDAPGGGKYDELLVAVVAKHNGQPAKGVIVECRLWDNSLGPVLKVVTPENGIVFFAASVAKDAVRPYFEATLTYGRETKVVSAYWGPTVPQPAKPPAPPQPTPPTAQMIKAVSMGFQNGAYCYRITTSTGADEKAPGIAATVVVDSALNLKVGFAHSIGVGFILAPAGELATNLDGLAIVRVELVGTQRQKGNIRFVVKGTTVSTGDLFVKTPLSVASSKIP